MNILSDAKGSFVSVSLLGSHSSVEFVLAFNASEIRCMEATGFVWSIDSVYCIASIVVSDGEYSFELSGSIT